MILYSHYNFQEGPVIEFENHDGKFLQLISHLNKKGFGPFRTDIKIDVSDTNKYIIELLPETEKDDTLLGLFYSKIPLSHKCLNPDSIFAEFLSKVRIPNQYQPRLGFYKENAKIETYYRSHSNKINKYIWDLSDQGWIMTHNDIKLKYV